MEYHMTKLMDFHFGWELKKKKKESICWLFFLLFCFPANYVETICLSGNEWYDMVKMKKRL